MKLGLCRWKLVCTYWYTCIPQKGPPLEKGLQKRPGGHSCVHQLFSGAASQERSSDPCDKQYSCSYSCQLTSFGHGGTSHICHSRRLCACHLPKAPHMLWSPTTAHLEQLVFAGHGEVRSVVTWQWQTAGEHSPAVCSVDWLAVCLFSQTTVFQMPVMELWLPEMLARKWLHKRTCRHHWDQGHFLQKDGAAE